MTRRRCPRPAARRPGERRTSFLARVIPPEADAPERAAGVQNVPRSVAELARRLPTERKVAQLFLVGFQGTDLTSPVFRQLRRLDLGGLVVGGDNYTDPRPAGHARRRGGRDRARRAPRAAVGDGGTGRRRVQCAAGPAPSVGRVRSRDARRRRPRGAARGAHAAPAGRQRPARRRWWTWGWPRIPAVGHARSRTSPSPWPPTPTPRCARTAGSACSRR